MPAHLRRAAVAKGNRKSASHRNPKSRKFHSNAQSTAAGHRCESNRRSSRIKSPRQEKAPLHLPAQLRRATVAKVIASPQVAGASSPESSTSNAHSTAAGHRCESDRKSARIKSPIKKVPLPMPAHTPVRLRRATAAKVIASPQESRAPSWMEAPLHMSVRLRLAIAVAVIESLQDSPDKTRISSQSSRSPVVEPVCASHCPCTRQVHGSACT